MTRDGPPGLAGRAAFVTGAGSGLGRAPAPAPARAGADVALLARGGDERGRAAEEIAGATGRRALALPLDLADAGQLLAAVGRAAAGFGRRDVLVDAAGTDAPGAAEDLAVPGWDRVPAVNLRAPFVLAPAAFPRRRRGGRGTIVNVSSVAGRRGRANASAYCAARFGLTGPTQALAAEGRAHGTRACVRYPGGMATNWGAWSPGERSGRGGARPPAADALPPEEAAALIVWIAGAPPELVLNEAVVGPLLEGGRP